MRDPVIRATTVEDIFYPSGRDALKAEVRRLLGASGAQEGNAPVVICPHAALEFAGPTMAAAFRSAAARRVERVVLIGPIHRDPPRGFALPESSVFQCPLGDLEVDVGKVRELQECSTLFGRSDVPHLEEHCLEVLLPFVRLLFPGAPIVPLLTGRAGEAGIRALARALSVCFGPLERTLVVASSNAAAFGPHSKGSQEEADLFVQLVLAGCWEELLRQAERHAVSACGAGGIASILAMGNMGLSARVVERSSSSDGKHAVHYAAVALAPRAPEGMRDGERDSRRRAEG